MSRRKARSSSLRIIGSIRSSWVHCNELQDFSAGLACRVPRQGVHHLDMLRRLCAPGSRELVAQLLLQRHLIGLNERIEPDAGAAVGKGDDSGVAHSRVFSDQLGQNRRVIDQALAATFAVPEIEQAAGDGLIHLLAGASACA